MTTRSPAPLVLPAGFVVGLAAEWASDRFRQPGQWIPDLLAGWALIAAGSLSSHDPDERRTRLLLATSGFTWFAGNFSASDVGAVAWVAHQAVFVHRGPLVHAVLRDPTRRSPWLLRRIAVAVGYLVALDPQFWGDEVFSVVFGLAVVAFAVHGFSAGLRVWAAGFAFGAAIVGGGIARWSSSSSTVDDASLLSYQVALVVVALIASGAAERAREHPSVAGLVVELGEARSDSLRDALAGALRDPTLEVGYWSPPSNAYVDAVGRPVPLPGPAAERGVTFLGGAEDPLGVLIHHPSLLDDPRLVESISTATRLAAVNARLRADVRRQVTELDASRRRILTAADEEHQRLERRLRDGAEARLEHLARRLSSTHRDEIDEATAELVDRVEEQLALALDELRALASGLHPRLPADLGLAGAIATLADRSATPAEFRVDERPLPAEITAALYFVCSEALANVDKHADAALITIDLTIGRRSVSLAVGDDGRGGADPTAGSGLVNLADRVRALGGRLEIDSPPGDGTRLVVELPLDDETQ